MTKKSLIITILILCIGLIMMGCPKKTVVKEEPSVKKEEAKAEAERMAKEKESKAKEEFERSIVAKRTPGIEGEVFESFFLWPSSPREASKLPEERSTSLFSSDNGMGSSVFCPGILIMARI